MDMTLSVFSKDYYNCTTCNVTHNLHVNLGDLHNSIFDALQHEGFFFDPVQKEVEEIFLIGIFSKIRTSNDIYCAAQEVLDQLFEDVRAKAKQFEIEAIRLREAEKERIRAEEAEKAARLAAEAAEAAAAEAARLAAEAAGEGGVDS